MFSRPWPCVDRELFHKIALFTALSLLCVLWTASDGWAQTAKDAESRPSGPAPITYIVRADVAVEANRTCFSIVSDGRLAPEIYTVRSPERVVIDATDAAFRMQRSQKSLSGGRVGAFRYGRVGAGQARIVIDVAPGTHVSRVSSRRLPTICMHSA